MLHGRPWKRKFGTRQTLLSNQPFILGDESCWSTELLSTGRLKWLALVCPHANEREHSAVRTWTSCKGNGTHVVGSGVSSPAQSGPLPSSEPAHSHEESNCSPISSRLRIFFTLELSS